MDAISSYKTFLMYKASGSSDWAKLVDIKTSPATGSAPELLETTTLSDGMKTFINGILGNEAKEFTTNYNKSAYQTLVALQNETLDYAIWLGATESGGTLTPSGSDGKWSFKGQLSVWKNEASVNAVQEMTISIAPSSVITFE